MEAVDSNPTFWWGPLTSAQSPPIILGLDFIGDFQIGSIVSKEDLRWLIMQTIINGQVHISAQSEDRKVYSCCNDQNKVDGGCNFPTLLIH